MIVDNYSTDGTQEYLDSIKVSNITVIKNEKNYGIAQALNRGVEFAEKSGYQWVLTMDQDSMISENMISEMRKVYSLLSKQDMLQVVSLAPIILYEGNDFAASSTTSERYYEKIAVITSGNLVKISAIKEIGGYEEKLFIDSVDFDFCLKLKEKGFKILVCNNAIMNHSLGDRIEKNIFGRKYYINLHSPIRKYYISRNHIYITKKYFTSNKWFCFKKNIFFLGFILQTIIYEEEKLANMKIIVEGISDGIKERFGGKTSI